MSISNQTARVLELIKRFNNGKKVCIESLQAEEIWMDKNERTIRRDLAIIKKYFPNSFELVPAQKSCYKAITKDLFSNFLKPENISLLTQTFAIAQRSQMFDTFDIDDVDKRIIESKLDELNKSYIFKNKPFESRKNDIVIFKALESAIRFQKFITIEYQTQANLDIKVEVKPYKILFFNEVFYLACELSNEEFEFGLYRISRIKNITDTAKTFQKNHDIEEFIKHMQTPFARYHKSFREHLIDATIIVDSKKAYFFKAKKFLASQKIEEEKDNGDLVISYKITQDLELEELVKRWLPYIKIEKPLSLQEKINQELKEYLKAYI